MGKNKYTKILNHLKSEEIDHKISLLNERMTSSGFYFTTGLDSGVPAVPGIPAVPPTYENVTGGLSNTNDFVWGNQGDGSNPNAPVNIPSNLYTTYNGEQVAAIRQIDGTYPNGVTPLAFGVRDGWLSTYYVGYLSSGGFTSVASVGVYANASTDLGRAYQQAYYDLGKPGTIFEHYTQKVIYLWGSLDCLFGDCKGASQYYPSNLTAFTTPKADYALYSYTLYIPTDASGVALPNRFMTDPGSPEVPEVPAIPPKPIVLDRYNLGDPNYYPGPSQPQGDIAGMGPLEVDALLEIIRYSPPGQTRNNAIQQLNQWAKPGSRNRDTLIKMGVPLEGASIPTKDYGNVAKTEIWQSPDGKTYTRPGYGEPDTTNWPSIKKPGSGGPVLWPTPGISKGIKGV